MLKWLDENLEEYEIEGEGLLAREFRYLQDMHLERPFHGQRN